MSYLSKAIDTDSGLESIWLKWTSRWPSHNDVLEGFAGRHYVCINIREITYVIERQDKK